MKAIRKPLVFVSYARQDLPVAKRLVDDLEANGASCWIDVRDIIAGRDWEQTVRYAIQDADYFLSLQSKNTLGRRRYAHAELRAALRIQEQLPNGGLFIIPVGLEVDHGDHRAGPVEHLHWVDLSNYDAGLTQLLRSVGLAGRTQEKWISAPPDLVGTFWRYSCSDGPLRDGYVHLAGDFAVLFMPSGSGSFAETYPPSHWEIAPGRLFVRWHNSRTSEVFPVTAEGASDYLVGYRVEGRVRVTLRLVRSQD